MCVCDGSFVLRIVLCIVGGGVNDNDGICEVVLLHVAECALECECFVLSDVVM